MVNIFFRSLDRLDEYNFGLTTSLVQYPNVSITIGASTIHTFLKAQRSKLRYKKLSRNLKTTLLGPPLSAKLKLLTVRSLARIYEKYFSSFDVLHLNDAYSYDIGLTTKLHVPKVLTFHNSMLSKYNSETLNSLSDFMASMDLVITPSKFMARVMKEKLGCKPKVVYNGVNTQLFNSSITRSLARSHLGISENRKVMFWNARLSPEKDLGTLVNAIPQVVNEVPSILFLIKGTRSVFDIRHTNQKLYENYILKAARRKMEHAGTTSNVRFCLDYVPLEKMPFYYRAADLFLHTARLEAFGLVLVEAMACKLPVVATNASCCPEVVGEGGLFFEPGDSQGLAEEIIKIVNNEDLRKELGTKARNRILKNFTWSKAAKEYLDLYLSVVH